MTSPEEKLQELNDSIESYERKSRKWTLVYALVVPAALLTLYLGFIARQVNQLNSQKQSLIAEVSDLEARKQKAIREIGNIQEELRNITNEKLRLKLEQSVGDVSTVLETNPSSWAIIFGGDPTHEAALDEVQRAKEGGYSPQQVQVFYRENSFRTVIIFKSREDASSALSKARQLSFNKDAYLVNLDSWCPSREPTQDRWGEYFVCN
jgi:hypothetical protein